MPWRVFTTDNDSQDEQASGLFGKRESDAMYFENDNPWGAHGVVRNRAVEAKERGEAKRRRGESGR